jgi:hypothetical protein
LAGKHSMTASVPQRLMDLFFSHFALRHRPALDCVISCLVRFIEEDQKVITPEREALLLLGLSNLAEETSPQSLRERYSQREIERLEVAKGLSTRTWAANLSKGMEKLYTDRDTKLTEILVQWQKIREMDTLPEVRGI